MKWKKNYLVLFALMLFTPLPAAFGTTITGTVGLPAGHPPVPSGGITVNVEVTDVNAPPPGVGFQTSVLIPESGLPQTYSFDDLDTNAAAQWRVHYFRVTDAPYTELGYYSSSGTTQWRTSLATTLDGGEALHDDIDMTLLPRNTMTGTVSLPAGIPADGDMDVTIRATDTEDEGGSAQTTIASGANVSPLYTLYIPADAEANWRIEYDYNPVVPDPAYLRRGYYSSGTDGTQWHISSPEITRLPGGSDATGIDMELLPATTISGTITRPVETAADPVSVVVQYQDVSAALAGDEYEYWQGHSGQTTVELVATETSADYILSVPQEDNAQWRISYDAGANDTYIQKGYYDEGPPPATQWNPSLATPLPGTVVSTTDIDMTLLDGGYLVSGTVSLPTGHTPALGGMDVTIDALYVDGFLGYTVWVRITDLEPEPVYSIRIPNDPTVGWKIRYFYNASTDYLRTGYFSTSGTQADFFSDEIDTLYGDQDHPSTSLELLATQTGDINGDNIVDLIDVIMTLQIITGQQPATQIIYRGADANGDGRIGLEEAIYTLNEMATGE